MYFILEQVLNFQANISSVADYSEYLMHNKAACYYGVRYHMDRCVVTVVYTSADWPSHKERIRFLRK